MYFNTTIDYLVSLVLDVYSSRDDGGESRVELRRVGASHRASDGRGREASSRVCRSFVRSGVGRRDERRAGKGKVDDVGGEIWVVKAEREDRSVFFGFYV